MIRKRVRDIELSIRRISEKASRQDECIRLDIGQPSFDTPQHVKEAAKKELEKRQDYAPTTGVKDLREEVAAEESMKQGINIGPEEVMVTTGGMGALYSVFASVLEDEKALFNDPCWGPYKLMSEINGNNWEQVRYFDKDGLRDEAREAMKDSKLVVVNTPSNPEGRVLSKENAKEIAEVSDDYDTLLISDEVYHRLTYGRKHVSPASFSDNSVIIGSMSKNHAMTGWRIGWLAANPNLVEEFAKATRAMTASPNMIGQLTAVEALENDSHVEKMRETYSKRRDLVVDRMNDLGWSFTSPEGAIYAFPEVGRDSWDFCLEMVEEGVAMVPGEPSGPESDQNIRICFGSATKEELEKGFDIIEDRVS